MYKFYLLDLKLNAKRQGTIFFRLVFAFSEKNYLMKKKLYLKIKFLYFWNLFPCKYKNKVTKIKNWEETYFIKVVYVTTPSRQRASHHLLQSASTTSTLKTYTHTHNNSESLKASRDTNPKAWTLFYGIKEKMETKK